MTQKQLWLCAILFTTGILTACQTNAKETTAAPKTHPQQPSQRPNILFIFSDDHAAPAISAYGRNLMPTPNIDRLAHEGVLFNHCFCTNSICSPSRAVVMSGKYSHLNGVKTWEAFNGTQNVTLPSMMRDAGYYTALVGKWHLGNTPVGFDEWRILVGQGEYYNPFLLNRRPDIPRGADNGKISAMKSANKVKMQGYATDIITDQAIDILEHRPDTQPFFMCLWHKAPHRNWQRGPKEKDLFKNEDVKLPETLFDDYATRKFAPPCEMRMSDLRKNYDIKVKPPFDYKPFKHDPLTREQQIWLYQQYIKDYLACVKSVDDNVGRTLKYLEEKGLLDNTIIVYSADQGFYIGENGWFDKRWTYDVSMRMPFLARYPKAFPAGTVANQMVSNLDFAPTFLDFAQGKAPETWQGKSFRSVLENPSQAKPIRDAHYYRYYDPNEHKVEPHFSVRTDDYKYIVFPRDKEGYVELFDLKKDPNELKNVAEDPNYAQVRKEMVQKLKEVRKRYNDHENDSAIR